MGFNEDILKFYTDIVQNMNMDSFDNIFSSYQERFQDIKQIYDTLSKSQIISKNIELNMKYQYKLNDNIDKLFYFHISE